MHERAPAPTRHDLDQLGRGVGGDLGEIELSFGPENERLGDRSAW